MIPRGNVKIKLWTGGFTHQPSVDPPWLLKLLSVLAMLSMIGTLLYAVSIGLGQVYEPSFEDGVYIAILHFVLPVGVTYTVTTNSPASRILILGYFLTLYISTLQGKGFLGSLELDAELSAVGSTAIFLAIVLWLFVSPKMRFYFALISGKPVSSDIESKAAEFMDDSKLNPKVRVFFDWVADHLETIVLLGFSALAIYAYVSVGG